ncbi:methyltransferase domain-containing protein [Streptomyces sp. IBSBF 2435]|uniref:methyltransferase domain-containing protein n=1 Tax=Streptomyces sp. IBSBF 2435 TaxID=2903531 RepID=UPI002FDC068F
MTVIGRRVRPGWAELVRFLLDSGAMAPQWGEAFCAVDRARFLPPVMWPYDMATRTSAGSDRRADRAGWYGWADADVPITTQWDDGRHEGAAPGRVPTSSASAPSVVAAMLRDLDVHDGVKVLEIGTGTGWNAALLAHRLGDRQVTSVEVDPQVAATATAALHGAGRHPDVVVADGLLGHPPGARYDRLIATVAVRAIPYAWVRQTAPGGVIVAPWGTAYSHADAVVRLAVADDRTGAQGRFTRPVEFMKARAHRTARAPHSEYVPGNDVAAAAESVTTTGLTADDLGHPFPFAAGLRIGRDCTSAADRRGASVSYWLYGISDRSWAAAVLHDGRPTSTVYQGGPRRLWDELETTHRWWTAAGRPGTDRFGLTTTPDGDRPWLDAPQQPL